VPHNVAMSRRFRRLRRLELGPEGLSDGGVQRRMWGGHAADRQRPPAAADHFFRLIRYSRPSPASRETSRVLPDALTGWSGGPTLEWSRRPRGQAPYKNPLGRQTNLPPQRGTFATLLCGGGGSRPGRPNVGRYARRPRRARPSSPSPPMPSSTRVAGSGVITMLSSVDPV